MLNDWLEEFKLWFWSKLFNSVIIDNGNLGEVGEASWGDAAGGVGGGI